MALISTPQYLQKLCVILIAFPHAGHTLCVLKSIKTLLGLGGDFFTLYGLGSGLRILIQLKSYLFRKYNEIHPFNFNLK
jgi:hypothetical protein